MVGNNLNWEKNNAFLRYVLKHFKQGKYLLLDKVLSAMYVMGWRGRDD